MGKTERTFLNLQCNISITVQFQYMAARFDSANAAIKKMESPSLDTEPAAYLCSRPRK